MWRFREGGHGIERDELLYVILGNETERSEHQGLADATQTQI
jgi:hypothetical protein